MRVLAAVALLLATFSCSPSDRTRLRVGEVKAAFGQLSERQVYFLRLAQVVADADPEEDAKRAVLAEDRRLIGIMGIGLFFPVENGKEAGVATVQSQGCRLILGVGDARMWVYDGVYHGLCYEYAVRYNSTVLAGDTAHPQVPPASAEIPDCSADLPESLRGLRELALPNQP